MVTTIEPLPSVQLSGDTHTYCREPSEEMLSSLLLLLLSVVLPVLGISSLLLLAWKNPRALFAPARRKTSAVLVLGDVGRSPRMMYHTESLAKLGWETSLIGYRGELLPYHEMKAIERH